MRHLKPALVLLALTALAWAAAPLPARSQAASTNYTITDLGGLPGAAQPYAINVSGQVAGSATAASGAVHAFRWTPAIPNGTAGTISDLGLPSGFTYAQARGINASGQVVGWGGGSVTTSLLWSGGKIVNLGGLKGNAQSLAYAINASGEVAGWSVTNAGARTYLWKPSTLNGTKGTMVDLKLPGGSATVDVVGYGMNTYGKIASYNHNFIWTPTTPNGTTGTAMSAPWNPSAINDSGQTTGYAPYSYTNVNGSTFASEQPAFYDPSLSPTPQALGFPVDTGMPAGSYWTSGRCYALTGTGMMVGSATGQNSGTTPYGYFTCRVWASADGMHDLNVNPSIQASGWVLTSATGVNDSGQIIGSGTFNGQTRGYLLTPQ